MVNYILVLILFVYAIIISVLYWDAYINKVKYQEDRESQLNAKQNELTQRESIVVDKEICFRELTKLKIIQTNILDILKSNSVLKA